VQVYHPNIDLEGNVCLNILREDWKPVLSINSILYGLTYLFLVSFPFLSLTYFMNSLLRCIILQLVGVFHGGFIFRTKGICSLPLCGISKCSSSDCEKCDDAWQDPNPDDPLNHEAAEVLRDNPRQFDINVKRSMSGGYVAGNHFPRCI
jgi:hypothetical protein